MTTLARLTDEVPLRRPGEAVCDFIAIVVLAAAAAVAALTFRDYGLGWDDYTHAEYADLLLRMYGSGFTDRAALSFANLYMYGGGFDMIAALMHHLVPLDVFETRRLVGAAVGVGGLAMTWRLGRLAGGPLAGLAALLLLTLCPVFYGHLFMNPKDAPFAVAMIALMLGLARLARDYPAPSPVTVTIIGLAGGAAFGSRVLAGFALIAAAIGFLPLILDDARRHGRGSALRRLGGVAWALLPGLALAYLVMGLVWPWAVIEPANPIRAVTYFSHFFEKPWKEMFDGTLIAVPDMPWSYLPTLFTLQLPEVLIVLATFGVAGTVLALKRREASPFSRTILLMLTLAALLPLAFAMVKRPALYNGIRHFIFVIPPMAVLGGVALAGLVRRSPGAALKGAVLALFAAGLALPFSEMVRLHPYQYTYFNHSAGTVRRADNLYMLDYWGLAFKQASSGLHAYIARHKLAPPEGRKWKVAVCGPQRPAQVALGPDYDIGWDSAAADFAMTLGEFYCKGLTAPVVVEIDRDDVTYARVYDIRNQSIASLLAIPAP
jgi:hypothetical protein